MHDRRSLIQELHSTLGRFELALSLVDDALVWIDEGGAVVWCNRAFDHLVEREHIEVVGQPLVRCLPLVRKGAPVAADEHPSVLLASEDGGEIHGVYQLAPVGRGRVIALYGRTSPRGRAAATFVLRDITARTRADEQARALHLQLTAANQELEAFAYSVSHDLRTPLRAIDGFGQAILEDYGHLLDAEGQDHLRRIRAASQRMARLIDDMLFLSRVTRADLRIELVDVSALAEEIASELKEADPAREVEFRIAPGLVALADASLLRHALTNLLENAWKFTRPVASACIEVGEQPSGDDTAFFVRDTGVGFDMAYSDRLFGAFQRLHTSTEFPGTGIGLAIVRRIVHRHGGTVWAESAPGRGATFYFTVPNAEATPALGLRGEA